jgi:uncharacterized protein YuzE
MKIHDSKYSHDPIADAIYIKLSDNDVAYTKNLDDSRMIDYDSNGNPIGVELLCVSHGVITDDLPNSSEIERLLEANHIKVFA